MGEVFLAHDDELGRNIAIKLLPRIWQMTRSIWRGCGPRLAARRR
jgi:hypothetical protein